MLQFVLAHEEAINASGNPEFKVPDRSHQLAPFLDTFMGLISELESSFIAFGRAYAHITSKLDILARFARDAATENVSEISARAISMIQLDTLDSTHDLIQLAHVLTPRERFLPTDLIQLAHGRNQDTSRPAWGSKRERICSCLVTRNIYWTVGRP
jgi:hypothetical protein